MLIEKVNGNCIRLVRSLTHEDQNGSVRSVRESTVSKDFKILLLISRASIWPEVQSEHFMESNRWKQASFWFSRVQKQYGPEDVFVDIADIQSIIGLNDDSGIVWAWRILSGWWVVKTRGNSILHNVGQKLKFRPCVPLRYKRKGEPSIQKVSYFRF